MLKGNRRLFLLQLFITTYTPTKDLVSVFLSLTARFRGGVGGGTKVGFAVLVNSGCTGISCLNSLIFPGLSISLSQVCSLHLSLLCSLSLSVTIFVLRLVFTVNPSSVLCSLTLLFPSLLLCPVTLFTSSLSPFLSLSSSPHFPSFIALIHPSFMSG